MFGISDSTLQRRIRDGAFPPLERIGGVGRITGYSASTIKKLLNAEG